MERCEYGIALKSGHAEKGIPFLRIQNIREYQIDFSDISYISEKIDMLEKYRLEAGDIVVIRSGTNLGTAAVISEETAGAIHSSYSIMLRPIKDKLSSEYLAVREHVTLFRRKTIPV